MLNARAVSKASSGAWRGDGRDEREKAILASPEPEEDRIGLLLTHAATAATQGDMEVRSGS